MFDMSRLFSYKKDEINITYRIFGIKFSRKNMELTKNSIKEQNLYDLSELQAIKELIVCFIPNIKMMTGGIQSIYSICKYSREICPQAQCLIATVPGKYTYSYNPYFKNEEKIYRFEQIIKNAKNVEKLTLHIPEYYADKFYKALKKDEIKFLKGIKDLHINILNQNIQLMPEPKELKSLYKLTNNVTQTIGHHRYATQEVCDKWHIPTHFLSVHIDLSGYKSYPFEEKENIIVLSPDKAPYRQAIVEKLQKELPDFKLVTVQNMTFDEYMDLISRAYFTITFGEGFDGYFNQPQTVGSLGMAVYDSAFFPDESWLELKNVYESEDDMKNNIDKDIKELSTNKDLYYSLINKIKGKLSLLYGENLFKTNLEKFYKGEYTVKTTGKVVYAN